MAWGPVGEGTGWTTPILWTLHTHGRQRFVELHRSPAPLFAHLAAWTNSARHRTFRPTPPTCTGGDLITYEGWGALARPQTLRPLVDKTEAYNDRAATRRGDRKPLADAIVAEAGRLLAGPWPPLG
ncbi:hypothetical protein [Streptomyces sp. c-19]|uniref:hypothetical protein n=1 Tax=Streptomyces sp. c-19 TaxID=2789275 RepID=UPI00397F0448